VANLPGKRSVREDNTGKKPKTASDSSGGKSASEKFHPTDGK
jgi:hypothetical protein